MEKFGKEDSISYSVDDDGKPRSQLDVGRRREFARVSVCLALNRVCIMQEANGAAVHVRKAVALRERAEAARGHKWEAQEGGHEYKGQDREQWLPTRHGDRRCAKEDD